MSGLFVAGGALIGGSMMAIGMGGRGDWGMATFAGMVFIGIAAAICEARRRKS